MLHRKNLFTSASPLPLECLCYLSLLPISCSCSFSRPISTLLLPGAGVTFISTPPLCGLARAAIHPCAGLMESEGKARGGRWREGKRDSSLSSFIPQTLHTYCYNAVTVKGWVVLTCTINYQWTGCVLMLLSVIYSWEVDLAVRYNTKKEGKKVWTVMYWWLAQFGDLHWYALHRVWVCVCV